MKLAVTCSPWCEERDCRAHAEIALSGPFGTGGAPWLVRLCRQHAIEVLAPAGGEAALELWLKITKHAKHPLRQPDAGLAVEIEVPDEP